MIHLAGIALSDKRFSALPSVAGPEEGCGQQLHITAGLRGTPRCRSSLGLRQPARRSLRLLKAEAQASCPSRRFVNPRAVIRNGRLGEKCLKNRAAKAKPEPTWSSPLEMENITQGHPKKCNSSPLDLKIGIFPSSRLMLVSKPNPSRCHSEGSFLTPTLDRRHKDCASRPRPDSSRYDVCT